MLYTPTLQLPIKTLDVSVAGQGYGPHVLPFLFDLVNLVNKVGAADSSRKRGAKDEFSDDLDGSQTINYLIKTRSALWRICSTHASSLGLHLALYFYSASGTFQPTALLTFLTMFRDWSNDDFKKFIYVRAAFEQFLLSNRGITEGIRKLGSGARSRPRIMSLYRRVIADLGQGKSVQDVANDLAKDQEYGFLIALPPIEISIDAGEGKFSRDTKGAAFLRDALPSAPKCATCGGILHRNGMHTGHQQHRREGGSSDISNAQMQHPFCNSTVRQ